MKLNKLKAVILAIFCITFVGLHLSSTTWFRLQLADYYKNNAQYEKAILQYNKILRKDALKKKLDDKVRSQIDLELGYLYAKAKLTNLAIESYAKGNAGFSDTYFSKYHNENDLWESKLLAIGLLEGGAMDKAVEVLKGLKKRYPQFQDADSYIEAALNLKKQNMIGNGTNYYLKIGGAYIQNQLFDEANAYFTKRILDYGVQPVEVLNFLYKEYSQKPDIREKVWGDNIYVSLEDFESMSPKLYSWVNFGGSRINSHYIAKDIAHRGNHSEFFDITYGSGGYNYWTKSVDIVLNSSDLPLGLRVYVKGVKIPKNILRINVLYPAAFISGTSRFGVDTGNSAGWKVLKISNLLEETKAIASGLDWNTSGAKISHIIIETNNSTDPSVKLFVDDIELYIEDK
jgi:tetratricopeptide (TPR) repeat protein